MILFYAGAALIAAALVLYILHPILTGSAAPMSGDQDEFTDAEARRRVALMALRDVEYDFATGKLDTTDYKDLRGELAKEALAAMDAEAAPPTATEVEGEEEAPRPDLGAAEERAEIQVLEAEIERYRAALRAGSFCPACGHPNPADARFCAECGGGVGRTGEVVATGGS